MLTIDRDKICHVIVRAQAAAATAAIGVDDDTEGMSDDDEPEPAEPATGEGLAALIDGLDGDEQLELVALSWIGRGSFRREEWAVALCEARHAHGRDTADYLMGMPLLGDYLADGLAELGHGCE